MEISEEQEGETLTHVRISPQLVYRQTSNNEKSAYSQQNPAGPHVDHLPSHSHYTVQPEAVYSLPNTQQQVPAAGAPYKTDSKNNLLEGNLKSQH